MSAQPVESPVACETHIPFFRLGALAPSSEPLGIVGGTLILDSGEAENTFVFRCQDRYLVYNALAGLRSVLFVLDSHHAGVYDSLIRIHSASLRELCTASGFPLPAIAEPLFVVVNKQHLTVEDILNKPSLDSRGFYLNQVSPTGVRIVTGVCRLLHERGIPVRFDGEVHACLGSLALLLHNKEFCWNLVADSDRLPRRADSVIVDAGEFLSIGSWHDLQSLYARRSGRNAPNSFYVKSTQDSGGNVAARLCWKTFDSAIRLLKRSIRTAILCENDGDPELLEELKTEIACVPSLEGNRFSDSELREYLSSQNNRRSGVRIILQPEVVPPAGAETARMGFTYVIDPNGESRPIAAAAQVYADADHHHYLGSYLCDSLDAAHQGSMLDLKIQELCRVVARRGYSGPLNFDACLDQDGEFTFIGDWNPRLTAVYPALAVRSFLRGRGLEANTILGLGYRGEFRYPDISSVLKHLSANGMLYTAERRRGVVLLPNIYRKNGFDAYFVNVPLQEAKQALGAGLLHRYASKGTPAPRQVF